MAVNLGGGRIRVERGDTLWGIAQRYLGNGARWRELKGFSGDPRRMPVGITLSLPGASGGGKKKAAPAKKAPSPKSVVDQHIEAQKKLAMEELDLFKKLFVNDPLAVDKALTENALRSAKEKFEPEFDRKLGEFMEDVGVNLETFENRSKLINELSGATTGLAGESRREYDRARESAREGFAERGTFFSGIAETGLGTTEVERGEQLTGAATNLQRQLGEFGRGREETIASQQLREINKGLAQKALPRLETFLLRFPGQNIGEEAQRLIQQFTPLLQGGGVEVPRPPELNRQIGL